jgi:type IV pilus assembly protein PilB
MGVAPYLVANSLNLVCAQRLVRKICTRCSVESTLSPAEAAFLGRPSDFKVLRGRGCGHCGDTGYKGRTGIFELMEMSPALKEVLVDGGGIAGIREQARRDGMNTLQESGLDKVRSGITTVEEVLRETG